MTIRALKTEIERSLADAGSTEASWEAEAMLLHVLGISRFQLVSGYEDEISEEHVKSVMDMVRARVSHVPLQLIFGKADFYGYEFTVDGNVLIPRFDTEVLVHEVLTHEKKQDIRLLDLCTGSGCIAVTLKKEGAYASVEAADLSEKALKIAKKNAEDLKTDVVLYHSDLFSALTGTYDVIVSNPPYIREDVIETLSPEVRDHDPHMALSGGPDGLYFYRKIAESLKEYLNPGGRVYLEIGCDQEEDVSRLLKENGCTEVVCVKDLAGLPRVVKGVRNLV